MKPRTYLISDNTDSSEHAELEFSIQASTLDLRRLVALVPYMTALLSESGSLSASGVRGAMVESESILALDC